jgi:chemotaxis protein MotA
VDICTIIGVVVGCVLILAAIMMGGSISAYIDVPSIVIVIGGCCAAVLTAFPLATVLQLPKVMTKAIKMPGSAPQALIEQIVGFAEIARRDGILALESMTDEMNDDLLITGIKMAVDGTDPELIEQILEAEVDNTLDRHSAGKGLLDAAGRYAPAFGMIGTLIGLVAMLANMSDPSAIGAGMAAALLTTLYGAILANVVFLPIADKLALKSTEEMLLKSIIIKGVMSIQSGDNPRVVQQKLMTFLPPASRGFGDEEMRNAA